ncbi:Carboxypeptidase [Pleurostoma richardsiae]|uniref:Carboxypeptidase n=1 Tax=Pleurostoma richardsiae TaxID=41990 RepID=A0AA38VR90_9PEZI|nr:Carboxypeptidase [Pleurostoma richardsiae]
MIVFPCSPFALLLAIHLLSLSLFRPCLAQFAPLAATNLTTFSSPVDPGITVTYKTPVNACTTAFDTQQQYTGWVSIPGSFPTNIFFWFVASREPTTELTVWINGGPGSSSMFGFFEETGPCQVVEEGVNQLGTIAREWGWDRASNMLFIDQPNQVGFSYDTPTNGSVYLPNSTIDVPAEQLPDDVPSFLFLNGTFSSQNANNTANTTVLAATAIWHLMQGFLGAFPEYNPPDNSSLGVNLFAESYGGKYGPIFAQTWETENAKRVAVNNTNSTYPTNSSASTTSLDIHLVSLGIVNGCVDDLVMGPYYVSMAVNNTYGLEILSPVYASLANSSFYQPGGCQDMISQCRTAVAVSDPNNTGAVEQVNSLCSSATSVCNRQLLGPYGDASGRSYYDIAHRLPESFPPSQYIDYLNTREVQEAIGAIVNFTDSSSIIYSAYEATGDWQRGGQIAALSALLQAGVRVGLIYGDRDFICNWMGGEAVSLAVAAAAGEPYASQFPAAGYAPVITNDSYIGGAVRQFGNLSFSRVYQAGHFVPAYQPETAFQVFARIILGTSVSTGEPVDLAAYNTTGAANATSSLDLPDSPEPTCYIRSMGSCSDEQASRALAGDGVVVNGVWYAASSDWPGATTTSTSTRSGQTSTSTSSTTLTGLFTATATPKTNGPGAAVDPRASAAVLGGLALGVSLFCFL